MTGRAKEKLRLNYREAWFLNLDEVTTNGNREVTFHPKRPQPSFISLLASGKQHLQQLANGGRLARQITPVRVSGA